MIICVYDPQHEEKVKKELEGYPVQFLPDNEGIYLDVLDFIWNSPTGNIFYFYGQQSSQSKVQQDKRLYLFNTIFNQPNQWDEVRTAYIKINGDPNENREE